MHIAKIHPVFLPADLFTVYYSTVRIKSIHEFLCSQVSVPKPAHFREKSREGPGFPLSFDMALCYNNEIVGWFFVRPAKGAAAA